MSMFKKQLPKVVLSLSIIITLASYFLGYQPLDNLVKTLLGYAIIITAFALPIGAVNLIQRQLSIVKKREKYWYLSVWMLFLIALISGVGIFLGTKQPIYNWFYQNINLPAGATIYSMTAIFMASAAYRSFRARNIDAFLLLTTFIITMLVNAPIGEALWSPIASIGQWLDTYPQTTGYRIIWIGWGIGLIALCVRYISGKESITGEIEE